MERGEVEGGKMVGGLGVVLRGWKGGEAVGGFIAWDRITVYGRIGYTGWRHSGDYGNELCGRI
jgi:hypothetical protein